MVERKAMRLVCVGLDMSFTGTGFCLLDNEKEKADTIKTKPADFPIDIERRVHIANEVFSRMLVDAEDKIDVGLVCIEDYYVPMSSKQMGSAVKLIELGSHIRERMYAKGIPFVVIQPTRLKKWVTGKGNSPKSMMLKEMYKKFGKDYADDNQADAAGLARMARHILEFDMGISNHKYTEYTKYQEDVMKKIFDDSKKYNWTPSST